MCLALCGCGARSAGGPTAGHASDEPPPEELPPGGAPTIEGLFAQLNLGLNQADAEVIVSLIPPANLFKDAVLCPEGAALAALTRKTSEDIQAMMGAFCAGDVSVEIDHIQVLEDRTRHYAPGDSITDGCTAGMHLTMSFVTFVMFLSRDGQLEKDMQLFIVLRVGHEGPWYIVGPQSLY